MDLLSAWGIYIPLVLYLIAIILLVIEFRKSRSLHLWVYALGVIFYGCGMLLLLQLHLIAYKISSLVWGLFALFYFATPLLLIISVWWNRTKMTRPNHPAPFSSPAFRPGLYFLTLATVTAATLYVASFELRLCGRLDIQLQRSGCAGELRLSWRQSETAVAISLGDELLAAGDADGMVSIFRIADRGLVRKINAHIDEVSGLDFSPDGNWLASISGDGTVRVWHVWNGECVYMFAVSQELNYWSAKVAFSPDGSLLAAGFADSGVQIWRMADGELVQQIPARGASFAFSPDSRQIAGTMEDESAIGIWLIEDGQLVTRLAGPAAQGVSSVAYAPDGKLLASSAWGGDVVYLWQLEDQTVRALPGSLTSTNIEFSPDGEYLFTGGYETDSWDYIHLLQVWRVSDGTQLYVRAGFLEDIESIAVSPGGTLLALGSSTDFIWLWRVPPPVTDFD